MKLSISKNSDINYLAKLVNITEFYPHPNPEVTRMKEAHIDGYKIAVGIDEQPGWFIYFPTLCQINPTILSYLNLYADKNINRNPEAKPGFFGKNSRVKTIKLQKYPSEGFLLPFEALQSYLIDNLNKKLDDPTKEVEFDEIEHFGRKLWICKKYVIVKQIHPYDRRRNYRDKRVKKFNKVIDSQFHFHYDTIILKKCPTAINPDDIIHISEKIHGTSGISAYVLCKQKLNWKQKIAKFLTGEEFNKYDYIYASRTVIKNNNPNLGFYECDVWKYADEVLRPHLTPGLTLYYEIAGFTPNGKYIQKNYDYGCVAEILEDDKYKEGVNFKIFIYRITLTDVDGNVFEFSPIDVIRWCEKNNLRHVTQLYYGRARDLYPSITEDWNNNFLENLSNDKNFYMEENSPSCYNSVPHEGIVIKIDNGKPNAFKVKTFKFLNNEQDLIDAGESNIEDNA